MPKKPKKPKLKIRKNEITIEEGEDSFVAKCVRGCKGKIRIKTPFGERVVKYKKKEE